MKVQDLAKELKITPRELLKFIRDINIKVKSGSTRLSASAEGRIRQQYSHRLQIQEKSKANENREPTSIVLSKKTIKVNELVTLFNLSIPEVMSVILKKGFLLSVNSDIDQETAIDIGKALNIEVITEDTTVEDEIGLKTKIMELDNLSSNEKNIDLKTRPPIITVMGHVDHGKTQLLDTIRKTDTITKEFGGITQHIGAYQIQHNNNKLTFLDTPGHEAFTMLRARGAQITDIAILVIAADDGVKPQTIEAIDHIKAADVPIIVAINKIDKKDTDINRVQQELSQHNLISEEFGGDTIMVPVSAKTGEGIDNLLEMIELLAETLELKASFNGLAKAVVIESHLSKQRGPVATVLVKKGFLTIGNPFIVGLTSGKVRAMHNDIGTLLKKIGPGEPAEIIGIETVPDPGSILEVVNSEQALQSLIKQRNNKDSHVKNHKQTISLESLASQINHGDLRQLNLVIKTDVHGSLEAIQNSINKIEFQDVPIRILHASTGIINESDVMLAKASAALIIGFGVSISSEAKAIAKEGKVEIKLYSIIYEMLEDIEKAIKGLYRQEFEDVEIGQVEVRQLFKFSKVGAIAGSYVTEGKVKRNASVKVLREGKEIAQSSITSLKRFQDDIKEVNSGFECGIVLESFNTLKEKDILIVFEKLEKKQNH